MDTYSVELRSAVMPLPLSFTTHAYFVTTYKNTTNRYEQIGYDRNQHPGKLNSYLYKNYLPPAVGFRIFSTTIFFDIGPRLPTKSCGTLSGAVGSPAHELWNLLENDFASSYPYPEKYNLVSGPNSNTFAQWVIDQVPECGLVLPWNAWGKNYGL